MKNVLTYKVNWRNLSIYIMVHKIVAFPVLVDVAQILGVTMRKTLIALLFVMVSTAAASQDAPATAFMRAMTLVPISAAFANSGIVSYADYHSGITARGFEIPENWAAFESGEAEFPPVVLPPAGPNNLLRSLFVGAPEYESLLGFDFFDVGQAVEFGSPPPVGQVLIGDFDPDAIINAFSARNYSAESSGTGTLLCPENGCDTGFAIDLLNRNPANPFGGNIGRNELTFVSDRVFLNSPDLATLHSAIETYENPENSLAALAEVQAVGRILAEYPFVNIVTLTDPLQLGLADPAAWLGQSVTPEQIEAFVNSLSAERIAPYSLMAMASTADAEGEYGLVLLTYGNSEDAESAASVIDTRLITMKSQRANVPYTEVYGDVGTLEPARVIYDEASGLSTVVVRLAGESPANAGGDAGEVQSDRPYLQFFQGFMMRDLPWLAWGGTE